MFHVQFLYQEAWVFADILLDLLLNFSSRRHSRSFTNYSIKMLDFGGTLQILHFLSFLQK